MTAWATKRLIFLLILAIAAAWGQEPAAKPTVLVGIADPANLSRATFQPDWERDQMVRDINSQSARDKKAPSKIQAVPLRGSTLEEVAEEARGQNCRFIVLTSASETIGAVGYDSAAGIPDPMKPAPDPNPGAARVLGVKYSISRVGEPGVVSHGAILAQGTGDGFGQSALQEAFRDVSMRIVSEIKKQKVPPLN